MKTTKLCSLLLVVLALGCKARTERSDSSQILEDTVLGTYPVDLTTYKAPGPFNTTEVAAIRLYTQEAKVPELGGNFYTVVNRALRDNDQSILRSQATNIMNIASGANKLRGASCTTRRFVDLPYSVSSRLATVGERYVDKAFFSSTLLATPPPAFAKRGEVVITESPSCPNVESYSSIPSEREVLFPPGTEFEVTRGSQVVAIGGRNYTAYYLRESKSGQKVKALAVGVGGKGDDDSAVDGSKFVGRTFTGRDASGRKRSIKFVTAGSATYTGAAGKPVGATWSVTGNLLALTTTNLYYQIMSEERICFRGEDPSAAVTSSCLVYDEDGDGEPDGAGGGAAAGGGKVAVAADASITYRDFFFQQFDEEGTSSLHFSFLQNGALQWYQNGHENWSNGTWQFFANPARIQIVMGGTTWWMHVVDAQKICYTGPTYQDQLKTCYIRK